jgi:hypothetical protein
MDIQTIDIRSDFVHLIGHDAPESLTLGDISCIQILLDLVLATAALVDVLVDVLDGLTDATHSTLMWQRYFQMR